MDAQQLQAIRHYFQQECPNQTLPVIIAVATHIDRLRPVREWKPPYQILQPDNAKAHQYPGGLPGHIQRVEPAAGMHRSSVSCP